MNDTSDKYANFSHDELVAEINRLKKHKKYGLVWEHKTEKVIEDFETQQPYLEEVTDKRIEDAPGEPTNLIIEGDNFEALSILNYTHSGKVDVIYIDPPYNTENEDLIYNDKRVRKDDPFKHSKWCDFIHSRLTIARNLLKREGLIFISIDYHEESALRFICDEIFGSENYISTNFVLDNLKGKTNDNFVTSVGSRLLIYANNKEIASAKGLNNIENIFAQKVEDKYKLEDENGYYNDITFKKTGQGKLRSDRPYMYYPILERDGVLYAIEDSEYEQIYDRKNGIFNDEYVDLLKNKYNDYNFILPISSQNEKLRWTSGFATFKKKMNSDIHWNNGIKQKTRPEANEMIQIYASGTPKSLMYKPSYSSGTQDYLNLGIKAKEDFPFPKPLGLMRDILMLVPDSGGAVILDFFAGSGTTGQAVLELNKEDGGHRQFILCTNNGDKGPDSTKIAEEITYPRIKTVITGQRQDGSKYSDGIPANLRYYKINHREKKPSIDANRQDMATYMEDIIQVKENAYKQLEVNEDFAIYESNEKYVGLVFEPFSLEEVIANLKEQNVEKRPVKLYVFSYSRDAFEDDYGADFEIEFVAMPEGLLKTYAHIVEEQKKEDL